MNALILGDNLGSQFTSDKLSTFTDSALSPKQLGKKKTFQRELNLIFDFFCKKKSKIKFSSLCPLCWAKYFPNCLGLKAIASLFMLKRMRLKINAIPISN
ncbi:MAG: hypothetical protein RIS64_3532 [Bacteroidota bacterium]